MEMSVTTAEESKGDSGNIKSGLLLNSMLVGNGSRLSPSLSATPPPSPPLNHSRQRQGEPGRRLERRKEGRTSPVHYPSRAENQCKRQHHNSQEFRELSAGTDDSLHRNESSSKDMPGEYTPAPHISPSQAELVMVKASKFPRSMPTMPRSRQLPAATQQGGVSSRRQHNKSPQVFKAYNNDAGSSAIKLAADCLHAQDYSKMISLLAREAESIPTLFGQGLAYYKLKKLHEATECLTKMDDLASADLNEHANVYLANYYLGEIHIALGQYRKAAKHYHKSSRAYSPDTAARCYRIVQPSLATVLSKQGSALRHSQQILEAVTAYKTALGVVESDKDKLSIHTSLGNLYQSLGENASALEQYEQTITLAEKLQDYVSLGWAHGNIGNAYLGLYQKDKALKHLEKSLDLTLEHEPTPQAIGRAYNNLGTAYQSLNDLKKAEEYYDLALSQAIYGSDTGGQARVYGNYGNLLMVQKRYDLAISHYSEALSIGSDRATKCTAHHNRGCAFYERAEANRKKIVRTPKSSQDDFYITYGGPTVEKKLHDPPLIDTLKKDYINGRNDLMEVVAFHEETFQTIKGSAHGLSLSVSLFETNSRTFHRLQDCFFNLGEWSRALEFAEQSRARTLGELLLQRKTGQLEMELSSPLKIGQVERIIQSVQTTVVFISYTGARLLTWVFSPLGGKIVTNRFQVLLEDDQFDGKSLDYFLRYSLSEKLIEDSVEMYSYCTYDESPPLTKLFEVFGKPLLTVLNGLDDNLSTTRDVIVIPDSYTNLMPLVALLNTSSRRFLGDKFCFRTMPSLLILGIVNQLPQVTVSVPKESPNFCIVGNPTIPTFSYQGETWNLGKLPYATQEAEAVAHILKCAPTLHEQATKMLVQSMISKAKVVHLATHGSASAGFLAFAGLGSSRSGAVSDEKVVLLYPEDVEKLSINPALVVLSSCDSGRGMMKADGIQGMARAFILAGAQAVLTTLWRVPDESAAVFMQFFYQYMMDGFKGSHALRKAILSIRSFQKYSRYIHWSGYQLTGREIQFQVTETGPSALMRKKMGPTVVFPRMDALKSLKKRFIDDSYLPTDVQIILGVHGLKPREVMTEFVTNHHQHFTGGVFFVSARNRHFMRGAEEKIKQELKATKATADDPLLLIFESLHSLPPESSYLHTLLCRNSTHVLVLLHSDFNLDVLKRQIDTSLMRGANVIELQPLSELHVTQRLVHNVVSKSDFIPYTKEQDMIANIAKKTIGSPDLIEVVSALLAEFIERESDSSENAFLKSFCDRVCSDSTSSSDDWAVQLVREFSLSKTDYFLLSTLSLFGSSPVPRALVEILQVFAITASSELPRQCSPLSHLVSTRLLDVYPSTVIWSRRRRHNTESLAGPDFYCVPQIIADAVRSCMDDKDLLFSTAAAHRALDKFYLEHTLKGTDVTLTPYMAGLAQILADLLEREEEMEGCYKEVFRTYLLYAVADSSL